MSGDPAPDHPEIVRILAPNPGPMSLEGTNTYVVTTSEGNYVIDPGPDDAAHLARVREAAGEIAGVLLTHGHSDHSEGVSALGAPLLWGRASGEAEMEAMRRSLESGIPNVPPASSASPPGAAGSAVGTEPSQVGPFTVVPTPGHAADHVAFMLGSVCFCGDLILGSGSSIVPPAAGGGSLADYMRSLDVVEELGAELLAPGHGPWITDPAAKIDEYREHRLDRERRLLGAISGGERSRSALVANVWDDVPEILRPAAAIAMQAHLEKLAGDGVLEGVTLVD